MRNGTTHHRTATANRITQTDQHPFISILALAADSTDTLYPPALLTVTSQHSGGASIPTTGYTLNDNPPGTPSALLMRW